MKICAVIPAYNEARTIAEVIQQAKQHVDTVFVVDDGSNDDTAAIARQNGALVIRHNANQGIGATLQYGYDVAISQGFDYIVQLDSDGQHDPKRIPEMLEAIRGCDMVIASRFLNRSYQSYSLVRKLGISFFTFIINLLTHAGITDTTSGYRAYRTESLSKLSRLTSRHWAVEQTVEAAKKGFRIKEVSIEMPVRNQGKSHLNLIRLILYPFRMVWAITKVMLFRPCTKETGGSHLLTKDAGKPRIGLIAGLSTFVKGVPDAEGASQYIRILEPLSSEIIWVTATGLHLENKLPENVTPVAIRWDDVHEKPVLTQVCYHLFQQIRITLKLVKLSKVSVFLFARGLDFHVLPISFARILLRKKVVIKSDGRSSFAAKRYVRGGKIYQRVLLGVVEMMERIAYFLANSIVVDSSYALNLNNMQKYMNKIHINAGDGYVDIHLFKKTKELSERKYDAGYVGRFSRKKGFLEFMQALPLFPSNEQIKVAIIGGEAQDYEIQEFLVDVKAQNKAEVIDWVKPEKLVQYLNEIKLIVIPSYEEGMPKTALEAMACGCIVVATPVGSIPEIIQDGKTGFILKNNSPREIAEGIDRALGHADLQDIALNARSLIEREYTYEVMLEKWRCILNSL